MARSLSLPLGMVVLSVFAAPVQADTIYQCTGKDGAPVLQNLPCESGSEVWVQKEAPGALPAAKAMANDGAITQRQDSENADASSTPAEAATAEAAPPVNLPSEPALGMSQQQVKAILGEPTSVTREEVVQGRQETWTYGDSHVLQFDPSGQLSKK